MIVSNARVDCDGTDCGSDMVEDGEFVAKSPVCSGDSGGPALDAAGRVAGITSRGDEKCTFGIYTSVAAWRDFILENAQKAATEGRYVPPAWASPKQSSVDPGLGGSTSSTTTAPTSASPSNGASSSTESPSLDPLGQSCTNECPGGYVCWAEAGTPPGTCVPTCSAANDSCPAGYGCDVSLGACTKPSVALARRASCAMPATPSAPGSSSALWLGVALFGWSARRRRRPDRATSS
jgi:hypothetical protein